MRVDTIAIGLILLGLGSLGKGQQGTCGGDCVFSEDCALEAGDLTCRCSYFHCRMIPPGSCGGGCLTDSQCSKWAGGDSSCVCGTLFDCIRRSELESPAYQRFAAFMLSAKSIQYSKKVAEMIRKSELKENKV